MAKRYGFFNSINGDRKYLATDLSQAFNVGITTGLKADNADNFKIVPNLNMQVKMLPGGAMIFGHYLLDEEEELINLDVAHAELNRIDRVVLRYDKFGRSIKTVVIKGTPALTPTAPAVLRLDEQFDLVLADIYIGKAVTTITTANITDMRETALCGFIGVKGAVSQIDFDAYLSQFTKLFSANGYQKLPNGFILQWGKASFGASDGYTGQRQSTITFPVSFPNACLNAEVTPLLTLTTQVSQKNFAVLGVSKTEIGTIWDSSIDWHSPEVFWFAIGY